MIIQEQLSLASLNSFGFEVTCQCFARAENLEEIQTALALADEKGLPVLVLGGGSNLVFVEDFQGFVLQPQLLGKTCIEEKGEEVIVRAQAGENWHEFVQWTLARSYFGLENLSLIPGRVGAAPMQNIGAYGVDLKDSLQSVYALDRNTGEAVQFTNEECQFAYRDSLFKSQQPDRYLITAVDFALSKQPQVNTQYGALEDELRVMGVRDITPQAVANAVCRIRSSKLPDPTQLGNAGSFFKNPLVSQEEYHRLLEAYPDLVAFPDPSGQYKLAAAWLIDRLGWKGKGYGNIQVHNRQALVLVNTGGGTGQEVLTLAQQIQASVREAYDVDLEIEPQIVGDMSTAN